MTLSRRDALKCSLTATALAGLGVAAETSVPRAASAERL
jgi:hypothetical protein